MLCVLFWAEGPYLYEILPGALDSVMCRPAASWNLLVKAISCVRNHGARGLALCHQRHEEVPSESLLQAGEVVTQERVHRGCVVFTCSPLLGWHLARESPWTWVQERFFPYLPLFFQKSLPWGWGAT